MLSYIQIASVSEGVYYRYKVVFPEWLDTTDTAADIQRTIGGTATMSYGTSYKIFQAMLRVDRTPATNYGSEAKLREWASATLYTTRQLYLRDHEYDTTSTTYNVFLVSPISPQYLDPLKNKCLIPVEFMQR